MTKERERPGEWEGERKRETERMKEGKMERYRRKRRQDRG